MLLNLMRDALWPQLQIKDCLENWNDLQRDLAEGSRIRVPRIKILLS